MYYNPREKKLMQVRAITDLEIKYWKQRYKYPEAHGKLTEIQFNHLLKLGIIKKKKEKIDV